MRALLVLALLLAGPHDRHTRESRRLGERATVGVSYTPAAFEFAPANGTGMGSACACAAVTGYRGEPMTFTRASVAECISNDGQSITQCAINQPRVSSGDVTSSVLGLWVENIRQNLVLRSRDLSNAAWTKASMTCALTATGLRGGANTASTCTATAGNGTVSQALTTGAASRSTSLYIKRRTGTGAVEVTRNNGTTWTAITGSLTTSWKRVVPEEAPGCRGGACIVVTQMASSIANPTVGIRVVTSGDEVDVDFVQDELYAFSTSPIETTAAAVTRSNDVAYFTGLTLPASNVGSMGASYLGTASPRSSTYPAVMTASTGYPSAGSGADQMALYSSGDGFVTAKCYAGNAAAGLFLTGTVTGASAAWRGSCTSGATVTGALGTNNMTASGATSGTFNAQTAISFHTVGGYQIEGVMKLICRDTTTRCL